MTGGRMILWRAAVVLALVAPATLFASTPAVEKPAALVADGIPPIPEELASSTRSYLEYRTAAFQSWNPLDRSLLITTRFGNTPQVHQVKSPGAARTQLSFEVDRVLI